MSGRRELAASTGRYRAGRTGAAVSPGPSARTAGVRITRRGRDPRISRSWIEGPVSGNSQGVE